MTIAIRFRYLYTPLKVWDPSVDSAFSHLISLGLSIDTEEESTPVKAESSDDAPPPLETAAASSMEEVD
ncbi:hypothetical protein JCM3765_007236 [Sporobolomyces pararoseus]